MNARAVLPVGLLWAFIACGGGSGSGGGQSPPTTPPPTQSQNPCALATLEADDVPAPGTSAVTSKERHVDEGNPRWRVLESLWIHKDAQQRRGSLQLPLEPGFTASGRSSADVGEIAIVQDEGDLVQPANTYDLRELGLRFTRNGAGGYDVTRVDGTFRQTLGTRRTLTDDDSVSVNVPFNFPFYGKGQTAAFINSDGNITFEEEDKASTDRNVARLLTGPPRVAPFLADLDPSAIGGRVFVHAVSDQYTVTWCSVRVFDADVLVNVQATLLPDGAIEFKYGQITAGDAVVGLSPGRTAVFAPVDLSASGPSSGGAGAVGERFAARPELDTVALSKKFYQTHPDLYDQLVVWTDQTYVGPGEFAYEQTIANEVRGIGIAVFDLAREFGSGGRLRSMAMMDAITKYPGDPSEKVPNLGENTTLSVLGQEVGHRWLSFVDFRDHAGQRSDQLLGRDRAHWSFFMDSDASVMEGNDIEDRGGGSFRTVAAVQRYNALDQYLMGLIPESEVPPFFYVENPTNVVPARDREGAPRVGVTFNGTRRDVLIQDVIAIHGPRSPSAAQTSKVHRQAFVYVVTGGRSPDPAHIARIDRIRQQWEGFFSQATSGKMTADTRIR